MRSITITDLENALTIPACAPGDRKRLKISEPPEPFVSPPLRLLRTDSQDPAAPFSVEVLFVEASAAVGKSTMARYLSSRRSVPLLHLAEERVSTAALAGMIAGADGKALSPFHKGELPVIVDALDEGRLRSQDPNLEDFLLTAGELLAFSRDTLNRPKLILFGRHEAIEMAREWLPLGAQELSDVSIKTASVEVGFFDQKTARELILAYAAKEDELNKRWDDDGPLGKLIDAYLLAIERALGLETGKLWDFEEGRAFAGYAPVLAALGYLLAKEDERNFHAVKNRLDSQGRGKAWQVIEVVLEDIIERERKEKFLGPLARTVKEDVPDEAYGRTEQLTHLARHVHKLPFKATGHVKLSDQGLPKYHSMVRQALPDHPFLRHGELANEVVGSIVLAHAVREDLLKGASTELLARYSRQPFLWRSLISNIRPEKLLMGSYIGYVLNSFWNDPIVRSPRVIVRSTTEGAANVRVLSDEKEQMAFEVVLPLTFYAQALGCDVDVEGQVTLEGASLPGTRSVFDVRGTTTIVCERLQVAADSITLSGESWLQAVDVAAPRGLNLYVQPGARFGWGGALPGSYPWNQYQPELEAPRRAMSMDHVAWLVRECHWRLPDGAPLTLNPDFSVPDDVRMRWVRRDFRDSFPALISLLVQSKLASVSPRAGGGPAKNLVRFAFGWSELHEAASGRPGARADLMRVVASARSIIR